MLVALTANKIDSKIAKSCHVKQNNGNQGVIHDEGYQFHVFYNIYTASLIGLKMEQCHRNGGHNGQDLDQKACRACYKWILLLKVVTG